MTTSTLSSTHLLQSAVRGNSVFSAISGAILVVASGSIASFMGIASPIPLLVMGTGIVGFALIMFYIISRHPISISFGRMIFAVDTAWVVATVLILAFDLFGLTTEGRWLLLIIGDIVALFAIAEFIGLRRAY
jgi:hypothetical protein